jgi:hypothetical protein
VDEPVLDGGLMEEHGLARVASRRVVDLKERAEKVRVLHI